MARTDHELEAYQLGVKAALAAASWIVDGNTKTEFIPAVLVMFDDGDPAVDDYLPRRPDLSGEFADAVTPQTLCAWIGCTSDESEAVCGAWEDGVSDTFMDECERILRAATA